MAIAKIIVNTTISASTAGIGTLIFFYFTTGLLQVPEMCNGILAGLVAITAPCAAVEDYAAFAIGLVAIFFYAGGKKLLELTKIDDAIGAFPVHGCCGIWGILATGLFDTTKGWFYSKSTFMAWQVYGILAIAGWTMLMTTILMILLKLMGLLRVDEVTEEKGLDRKYHRTVSVVGTEAFKTIK